MTAKDLVVAGHAPKEQVAVPHGGTNLRRQWQPVAEAGWTRLEQVGPRGEILALRRPEEVVVTVGPGDLGSQHLSFVATTIQREMSRINSNEGNIY